MESQPSTPHANWFKIIRPQTLFASFCPVAIGWMVGKRLIVSDDGWLYLTAALTLVCALALQVLSNLINDYYDFRRGTDKKGRVGFKRALAEGLVTERQMRTACFIALGIAVVTGAFLCYIGGWIILLIGLTAILFAWLYTATDYSLSYLGIADIFVFLYYGLIATGGTVFLLFCTAGMEMDSNAFRTAMYAGAVSGLISMCVLAINNLRDVDSDREAGKRTFPVRFGRTTALVALGVIVLLMPLFAWLAFGLSWAMLIIVPALVLYGFVLRAQGAAYNRCLMGAGMVNLCYVVLVMVMCTSCYHRTDSPRGSWAKGCDISWLSEMERDGILFRDDSLKPMDCIALLRSQGMNAVRLRVWVNHETGWSNKEDMIYLAKRVARQGQRIMIDIHYSDFFADPSHQTIPAAWQNYDYDLLLEAVREHTLDVLYALKEEGIKPEWVQIGNETPNGMLWPIGKLQGERTNDDQWDHYAGFTTMGYKAAKEAFPDINVIVHVDNAYEQRDWFWKAMNEHGGKWDIIGLSHYPMMSAWNGGKTWQEMNELAETNIRRLISEWHCPVMIAEVGMFANDSLSAVVMEDFKQRITAIDSCAGIFYWEPQVYGGWRPVEYIPLGWGSYGMGAFTSSGTPSETLKIMLRD